MKAQELYQALTAQGIDFYAGVPDSLLKHFCSYMTSKLPKDQHVITANEGGAVGLAIGRYLATAKPAVVYMQNSGLGNAVNPVVSLADSLVAGIPMVLLIGWRAERLEDGTQLKDEPQHLKQGQITTSLLETMGVEYQIIDAETPNLAEIVSQLVQKTTASQQPVALLVRKNTFESEPSLDFSTPYHLKREEAIEQILQAIPSDTPVISTTGMISREVFELRKKHKMGHEKDFLIVGAMGHASQVAMGVASAYQGKVLCLDGDGAFLMHLGSCALTARCSNLIHVVLNNAAHDSVGGQPTLGFDLKIDALAETLGYQSVKTLHELGTIQDSLHQAFQAEGNTFIEVRIIRGNRPDLGRPTNSPSQNKALFMQAFQK